MKLLTTICTAWFLVASPAMLGAQTTAQAEKLLESARHKEVMDGDLKGAIEQYRKIAAQFARQPEIAARALFQMGQCQEKLGQTEPGSHMNASCVNTAVLSNTLRRPARG